MFRWATATEEEKKQNMIDKFEKSVIRKDGCWDWKSCIHRSGYAPMNFHGNKQKNAHIVSWMIHKGDIPDGLLVLHTCDNRKCTNPDHLYLGTQADNVEDRDERSRNIRGENNPKAKLTASDIPKIVDLLAVGITQQAIADVFGVTQCTISRIGLGYGWLDECNERYLCQLAQ